ncbi:respiratory supercomplex factor 1, mitochondrial [Monosporozyma unispora]|nr:Respiratory supercomplex factor 1, mitochondrial [Kazachstania unispora]
MSQIPSSFDLSGTELEDKTFWERIKYHCQQQPFVPVGAILTSAAVVLAAQNIKNGNQRRAQYYFRWRVGLQGATLIALVAGSFIYGSTKISEKSQQEQLREKAKLREDLWIKELERRDAAVKERKQRAEDSKKRTQENEASIKNLEKELKDLESKVKTSSEEKK